jgi:hypothetical protein
VESETTGAHRNARRPRARKPRATVVESPHVDERGRPICKLIFEGAELTGKSTLTAATYQRLVFPYTTTNEILDGCYYLYCDIGVFSTPIAHDYLYHMAKIVELMRYRNVVIDKFHLSDEVYQAEYRGRHVSHRWVEDRILRPLGTRIVLVTISPDLLRERLRRRLETDPHYALIQKPLDFYPRLQERYQRAARETTLPVLVVDGAAAPDENVSRILRWADMPTFEPATTGTGSADG